MKKPPIRICKNVQTYSKKTIYELVLEDYCKVLTPPPNVDLPTFEPHYYFITSGDAVRKAQKMLEDIWKYAGTVRRALNETKSPSKKFKKFEKECWKMAGSVKSLVNDLKSARGDHIFMETEWDRHVLRIIPKDPKIAKNK